MPRITSSLDVEFFDVMRRGGVAVIRTDTLYGIVASADSELAVDRVYTLKQRDQTKSPIVLIGSTDQLYDAPADEVAPVLDVMWPGPYSIILPTHTAPSWIRRDNGSVAYRIPAVDDLRVALQQTGRLIAPSANPEGHSPAMTAQQAVAYFGDDIDLYVDGGEVVSPKPSTLLQFNGSRFDRLR